MASSPPPSLEALRAAALQRPRSWRALLARHDLLLHIAAYPPTDAHRAESLRQLDGIPALVRQLPAAARRKGDDSGVAGTRSHDPFELGIARWLSAQYPHDIDVDWAQLSSETLLQDLLRPALHPAEQDGFDSDHLSLRAWVRAARGPAGPTDLSWLLEVVKHARSTDALLAASWETAAVPLVWKLRNASATTARLAPARVVRRVAMRALPSSPVRHIGSALNGIERLPRPDAERVIVVARTTLSARCREVHAITYANPREVWMAPLGQGAELAIIGVAREHRLGLEANYGYILFSNGIPIGYGGVSPLFRQANTGINIFEPFRGMEAGFLWAQMLRAFRTLFGVGRFLVNPFQIGDGNSEALQSGAFWFHYRLGFRPATQELRELAAAELKRRQRQPTYRTPLSILRKLASVDLQLTLPGFDERDAFDEAWLPRLSVLATRRLGVTGARGRRRDPRATSSLAPYAALLTDVRDWPLSERRALPRLLRAKDAPVERDFVRAAQEHRRFYRGLIALARAESDARP